MSVNLQMTTYKRLVEDITALYDHARNTVVEAYWKIGKRIVEEEQKGETKEAGAGFELREPAAPNEAFFGVKNQDIEGDNTYNWNINQ